MMRRRSLPNADPRTTRETGSIRRASAQEAIAVWRELTRGEWRIIDCLDDAHGRRVVLALFLGDRVPRPWHRLSARERSVVAAVAAGLSNGQIAAALAVSVSTVAGHLRTAREKLGGLRRIDLVREWHRDRDPEAGT